MSTIEAATFTPAERKVLAVIDEHGTGDLATRTFVPAGTVHRATAQRLVEAGVLVYADSDGNTVARPAVEYHGAAVVVELPAPTDDEIDADGRCEHGECYGDSCRHAETIVVELPEPDFTGYVLADGRIVPGDHVFAPVPASDTLGVLAAAKDEHLAEKAGHPGPFPNLAALRSNYQAKLDGKPAARVRDAASRYRNSVEAGTTETMACVGEFHDSDEERVLPVSAFQLYESGRRRTECRACCKARVAAKKAQS